MLVMGSVRASCASVRIRCWSNTSSQPMMEKKPKRTAAFQTGMKGFG